MRSLDSQKARILLADDHLLFSDGLCGLINPEADLLVIGQVYDSAQVIPTVRRLVPDLLLLDVSLPRRTGHEPAPVLLRDFLALRLII